MKVLVTGAKGQLGSEIVKLLREKKIECQGVDKDDFDITNFTACESYIEAFAPTIVIHCGAYCNVDRAESQVEECWQINRDGTVNIATACKKIGAQLLYVSTDYVFDGTKTEPYEVDDLPNPLSVYGKTKLAGEQEIQKILTRYFIIRTSWLFGNKGKNFVNTISNLCSNHQKINVVCDQVGSPTYAVDLAKSICEVIQTDQYGIYHVTNEGVCTWADFAEKIIEVLGLQTEVVRVTSKEYQAKAVRPHNSHLSKKKLIENGFNQLPHWEKSLEKYFTEKV